ncbi:MAG: iron uptake transporter permease EfeU [Candidatus Nanopelagicales bacterium]
MFANYMIGLREGLEAALIIAILVAYLVKLGQREALPRLWAGVLLALGLSVVFGALLTFTGASLSDEAQENFAGVMSLVAVGLITWMIFWMAFHARHIKKHLQGEVDKALVKSSWAIAIVAFIAVAREGLETALFLFAGAQSSGESGATPLLGALLGIATAVVIGLLLYRGALKLNLSSLFKWTGALLVVIAAGVLRYGVHELQETGVLPGKDNYVLDLTGSVDPAGLLASLVRAFFNVVPAMTALEIIAWGLYIAIVMPLFFWVIRRSKRPSANAAQAAPEKVSA